MSKLIAALLAAAAIDAGCTPSEMNGKALYARMMDERAARCAGELFASFAHTRGGSTGPGK